jgi:ATP-dependent protease ClpP protease subunit
LTAEVGSAAHVGIAAGAGVFLALFGEPGQRFVIGARLVVLPFGAGRFVGFIGDDHKQHIGAHVAAGFSAACIMRAAVGAKAVGVLTPLPKQKL